MHILHSSCLYQIQNLFGITNLPLWFLYNFVSCVQYFDAVGWVSSGLRKPAARIPSGSSFGTWPNLE